MQPQSAGGSVGAPLFSFFVLGSAQRRLLAVLVAWLVFGASRELRAEPSESDRQQARALAAEGYDALQHKDYAVAEERFRKADKLVHAPTLVVDWARALTGLGRLVEAYERYELVLREGVSDSAPASWQRALQEAERELQALKPRLAWLTVNVEGPEHPTVFLDGRRVPSAAVGVPRAVNPGRRTVSAWARGYSSKQQVFMVREGQHLLLSLKLEPIPVGAPEEPEPVIKEVVDELPPPQYVQGGSGARRTLGYVAITIGGVGLVVGGVSGVLALREGSSLSSRCPGGTCTPLNRHQKSELESDLDRYKLFQTASTIGIAVGAAGVLTGGYLLLFGNEPRRVGQRAPRLIPIVGLGSVAVSGSF